MNDSTTSWPYRLWPGLIAFLLPIVFALLVLPYNVDHLLAHACWKAVVTGSIIVENYERVAHDLEARFLYATINAFGQLAAVSSMLLSAFVLQRLFGWRTGILVLVAAASFGVSVSYFASGQQDFIRTRILDDTLQMMQDNRLTFGDTVERLRSAIQLNMSLGLAGTAALLAGFGAVAVRASPQNLEDGDFVARELRLRLQYLTLLTLAGAVILVLLVAANKAALAWPQGMMKPEAAKAYRALASAVSTHWGGLGSGILLCGLVPALISIKADIARAAAIHRPDYAAQEAWVKANALEFAPVAMLSAALTTAAPLFAGPAIDIVKGLLGSG